MLTHYMPFSLLINLKHNFFAAFAPHFVFPPTCAEEKHLVSEKPLIKWFFKGTGVVLAGIECSLKICDFQANGIPDQERVDFFRHAQMHIVHKHYMHFKIIY